jgi:hypothetical protein
MLRIQSPKEKQITFGLQKLKKKKVENQNKIKKKTKTQNNSLKTKYHKSFSNSLIRSFFFHLNIDALDINFQWS